MSVDLSALKNAAYPHTYEHTKCSSILLTDRPEGLSAIRDPNVMAVIWKRKLPTEIMQAVSEQSGHLVLSKLFDRFASRDRAKTPLKFSTLRGLRENGKLFSSSLKNSFGMELYGDMSQLATIFAAAIDTNRLDGRLSVRHPELVIPDDHAELFKLHTDHGHKFRMHTTYMGGGIIYVPERFNYGDGYQLRKDHKEGLVQTEQLDAGDVIVFRGAPGAVEMGTPSVGLMHGEKRNPDARRLAYILTKTHSM